MPVIPPVLVLDQIDANGKRTMVGPLVLPAGSAIAPSLVVAGYGVFLNPAVPPSPLGPPGMVFTTTGARRTAMVWDYGFRLGGFSQLAWSDQSGIADKPETGLALHHDANNQLAQRNGANAQSYVSYNTYTDATHFERADLGWVSNAFFISTSKGASGGAARDLVLGADGNEMIRFQPASKLGFFAAAPVVKQSSAAVVNNVPISGTDDVFDDFADGDWAALRALCSQQARKIAELSKLVRNYGLAG